MEYCPYKDLSSYMERHFPKNNNNNISNYNNDPLIGPWDGFNELIVLYFIFQLSKNIPSFFFLFLLFYLERKNK